MLAALDLEPTALAAHSVHRIANARGMQVTCVSGITWITQEADVRDIILNPGQSVVLDRPGLGIVYAFKDALITVGPASQFPAPARVPAPVRSHAERAWA